MVPEARFELARTKRPLAPQASVSTYSTTPALALAGNVIIQDGTSNVKFLFCVSNLSLDMVSQSLPKLAPSMIHWFTSPLHRWRIAIATGTISRLLPLKNRFLFQFRLGHVQSSIVA